MHFKICLRMFLFVLWKREANIDSSYNGTKLLYGIKSNLLLKVRIRGNRDPNETMQISWSSMCCSEKACLTWRRNINYKRIQIIIKLKTWYGFVTTTPHNYCLNTVSLETRKCIGYNHSISSSKWKLIAS